MFTGVDDLGLTSEELARLREIDGMVDNTSKGLLKDASAFYENKIDPDKGFVEQIDLNDYNFDEVADDAEPDTLQIRNESGQFTQEFMESEDYW